MAAAGAVLADWRKPLASEDGVFLAKPHRERSISEAHRLRRRGASRRHIPATGHFVAFLSDRDGHVDVWLTQVGSGTVSQPDPRERALGTRESIDPPSGVLARWLGCHILGLPQASTAGTAKKSTSGQCQRLADSQRYTCRVWLSSIGHATAPGSRTTRPGPETRFS